MALVLVIFMVAGLLATCGKFECELCGEKNGKKHTGKIMDTEVTYRAEKNSKYVTAQ